MAGKGDRAMGARFSLSRERMSICADCGGFEKIGGRFPQNRMNPVRCDLSQRSHDKGAVGGARMRQDQSFFTTHNLVFKSDQIKVKHSRRIEPPIAHAPGIALQIM